MFRTVRHVARPSPLWAASLAGFVAEALLSPQHENLLSIALLESAVVSTLAWASCAFLIRAAHIRGVRGSMAVRMWMVLQTGLNALWLQHRISGPTDVRER